MLEADNLECLRGDNRLFAGLGFTLAPGELIYLQGRNGAGKTSLLRMLIGLLPPESGDIRWQGESIGKQRDEYHAALCYLGHHNAIKEELTPLENFHHAARFAGQDMDEDAALDALAQVGLNSMALVLMALLLNNLAGRRYPHRPSPAPTSTHHTSDPLPSQRVGVQAQDLDAALASFGELLDIERDDLEDIVSRANLQAQRRQWATVRCDDIMSRDVVTVSATCSVEEVWIRLSRHKVKALPVVNESQQLVGIVSLHDFFLSPTDRALRKIVPGRLVSEIMTTSVMAVSPDQPIADLVPAFSDGGLHHMPVVDAERRVVGMVTQSDLVAALFHLTAVSAC